MKKLEIFTGSEMFLNALHFINTEFGKCYHVFKGLPNNMQGSLF